ncbi:hypothetical protein L6452_37024 [Arctium lappa]|uniref:Uncharacterized protein n=1 Tax=Arctium lappa TaxID=4217 RepID=A0ACB8Y182_ARCLA|nr:hypothetical protein L6452_37024 [Arctium lappa]
MLTSIRGFFIVVGDGTVKCFEVANVSYVRVVSLGSLMPAMVRKNLVNKFNHLLEEGNVYVLKNFKVVENSGAFKVVESKLKIIFTLFTKVEKVGTHHPPIPMYGFQFASEKTVNDRLNNDTILTDIIGCLTVVGDVETVRGGFHKRELEIISEFNVTCKVTLWGALGENFADSHTGLTSSGATLIIIITSTRVKKFQGVLNFATSSARKVNINLDTNYVLALANRFANVCPRLDLGVSFGKAKKTVEEEMFENRMGIHQLLGTEWSNKPKGYIITLLGVIEHIEAKYGWFYLGCQGRCRKVNPIDGIYTCASCNVEYKNALTLFKLHLSVRDDTGVVTYVVLHKLAERMDTVASDIENLDATDDTNPPTNPTPTTTRKRKLQKHKSGDATMSLDDEIEPSGNPTSTTIHKRKFIVDDDETNN